MTWPMLAAALVWAAILAIGWHYLVAPFPPLARRIPATRRRRSTPPPPDRTMTIRIRPHLLTLVALVMAATCAGSSLAAAQGTAADSVHAKQAKDTLAAIRKRSTSTTIRRQVDWLTARENALLIAPTPPAPPAPPPTPAPISTARLEIRPSTGSFPVGAPVQFSATPKAADGTTLTARVSWSASPASVATISGVGVLTPIAAGTVTVTARADTASKTATITITAAPPVVVVDSTNVTPPAPSPSPSPSPAPSGIADLAILPQATVDVTAPVGYTVINVSAGGSVQAAIDTSACRVNIRLAAGVQYAPPTLRIKPCNEKYSTIISTNNGLPWLARGVRVTPALAAARNQAKIVSTGGNIAAVTANAGVHGYYFEDVTIATTGASALNAIVYLGTAQTTLAQVPGDFVFSHTLVTGTPTSDVKRCWYLNSSSTAIVDSWGGECHSNNGDSQCVLGLNGPGPYLIQNNYCEAGHEVIMFGGGDPSISQLVPSDITIVGNHITRPASWKGVWQVKNLIESKNARRMLIEGNVLENNWADGQVGYALLLKSVNQDGTAPWSTSQDITVRNNLIRNTGAGINLCASCQGTVVPATRITIANNVVTGVNCGIFGGEAREWQFLGALTNVAITHNTTIRSCGVETAVSVDAQPPKMTRFIFASNIYDNGLYGVHAGNGANPPIPNAVDTTQALWKFDVPIVASSVCQGGSWCNALPTSFAAMGLDSLGVLSATSPFRLPSHDGAPMGADAATVYRMTAGVVVADPSRALTASRGRAVGRVVATAKQSGYRATSPAQRAVNTKH